MYYCSSDHYFECPPFLHQNKCSLDGYLRRGAARMMFRGHVRLVVRTKAVVCSPKTLPRFLTIQEETRRCHSYFIRMISRTSSESDSSCNRVSNAIGAVHGFTSSKPSSLNKGAHLAFRRLPDSKVGSKVHLLRFLTKNGFHHSTSGISRVLVRLSANIVKVLTR